MKQPVYSLYPLPPGVWWSSTEQQSCSSRLGASVTAGMAALGSDIPLGKLGMVTPRGIVGKLGRVGILGMVIPLGKLGGLMPRGKEFSSAGMVTPRGKLGNLGRVPGISGEKRRGPEEEERRPVDGERWRREIRTRIEMKSLPLKILLNLTPSDLQL